MSTGGLAPRAAGVRQINDNLQLTAGYMATVNDSEPTDLRIDGFKISLVFGWHPLVEGMKRLQGEP